MVRKRLIFFILACVIALAGCGTGVGEDSSGSLRSAPYPGKGSPEESSTTAAPSQAQEPELDMDEYLYGHVRDAYDWHITTINGHHVSIPLPVIVISKTGGGAHIFSSKHLEEDDYQGFSIARSGKYENKIVEKGPDGAEIRPWDFSITKNVLGLIINSALLLFIVLGTARWYRKHDAREEAPAGGTGIMEMMVTMVEDDIIKDCVGEDYRKYSPYLLTAFFFIFINNLMGIVPFFPGGANITGNIAVTLVLALFTFFTVNLFGNKHYWKEILWPEVPTWLKVPIPLMPVIEIIGMFTKPFSLMVRLFANILAGHFMILGVIAVIFYVFTMLSAVFIGLSRPKTETD